MAGLYWHRALFRVAAILSLIFLVSACTSLRAPVVLTASFDPQVASFINESGSARISGQAFVRRNSSKLLRAVGTDVFLIPRTPYADERIAAIYGDRKQQRWGVWMPDADPLYEQYMRKTIASSGGSFSFNHVADGEYYVVAMIHLPSDYSFREFPVIERVSVQGGESVRLVMRGY